MDIEISRLLNKGAIEQVPPAKDQFLSKFFLVEKSSGGMRFIMNLKDLNTYMSPPHFKLENWSLVIRLMLPNYFMATIDLEDAYFSIPICPSNRRFLCFRWKNVTYQFTALPFGLATAPYIFTKILKPVIGSLRSSGFQSVVYLDDILVLGPSRQECLSNIRATMTLLQSLGFTINVSKS